EIVQLLLKSGVKANAKSYSDTYLLELASEIKKGVSGFMNTPYVSIPNQDVIIALIDAGAIITNEAVNNIIKLDNIQDNLIDKLKEKGIDITKCLICKNLDKFACCRVCVTCRYKFKYCPSCNKEF